MQTTFICCQNYFGKSCPEIRFNLFENLATILSKRKEFETFKISHKTNNILLIFRIKMLKDIFFKRFKIINGSIFNFINKSLNSFKHFKSDKLNSKKLNLNMIRIN